MAYDQTDRLLIKTVDRAVRTGVGRTFRTAEEQSVRVLSIDDRWVRLRPAGGQDLVLPRKIRHMAGIAAEMRERGLIV